MHTVTVCSHTRVTGEVKRILADELILYEEGHIVLEKIKLLIYNEEQRRYLSIGPKVADAFRTGVGFRKRLEEVKS